MGTSVHKPARTYATLLKGDPFEVVRSGKKVGAIVLAESGFTGFLPLLRLVLETLAPGGVVIARAAWWTSANIQESMRHAGFTHRHVIGRLLWAGENGYFECATEPWVVGRKRGRNGRVIAFERFGPLIAAPASSPIERRITNSDLSQEFLRRLLRSVPIPPGSIVLEPWATSPAIAAACTAEGLSAIAIFTNDRARRRAAAALPALVMTPSTRTRSN